MVGVAPPMPPIAGKPGIGSRGGELRRTSELRSPGAAPSGLRASAELWRSRRRPWSSSSLTRNPGSAVRLRRSRRVTALRAPPPQAQFGGGQGVNPLGGTMAADSFNAYGGGPPGGGYGARLRAGTGVPLRAATLRRRHRRRCMELLLPPMRTALRRPAYGAPPPAAAYGAPPGGYGGAPAPGYGSSPPAAQQAGYGAAPMQPYAQPGGGADQGGIMKQASQAFASVSQGGTRPTTRNALMTFLLPFVCVVAGIVISIFFGILAGILKVGAIGAFGGLLALVADLAGVFFGLVALIKMVNEVKSVTNNASFAWWWVLIPIYGIYWMVILLPQEVANAKRAVGAQEPVRSLVLYFFVGLYALASDVNDIAARTR